MGEVWASRWSGTVTPVDLILAVLSDEAVTTRPERDQRRRPRAFDLCDAGDRLRGARRGGTAGLRPPFYSACAGSMRLQSGSGILTPGWQIGSSILTP
jgi:hypothetical protein